MNVIAIAHSQIRVRFYARSLAAILWVGGFTVIAFQSPAIAAGLFMVLLAGKMNG